MFSSPIRMSAQAITTKALTKNVIVFMYEGYNNIKLKLE